jgi:LuxR family transcriptional regulator, maltose regulon positive regulatory protein
LRFDYNPPMPSPIIQTKLTIPAAPAFGIPRPQLMERLNRGMQLGNRLLLVSAPPGYGKTTLLSAWTQHAPEEFCWLSLDESDNDPVQFWRYFAAALALQVSNLLEPIQTLLENDPLHQLPVDLVLAVLINALAQSESPLVLILDDYHIIRNERIHTALIQLLARMPIHFHLAITSRSEPPLDLPRLRARGQLTEIHMDALGFSESESADFLNRSMCLDLAAEEITELNQRTKGWAAGLQLAALSLQAVGKERTGEFIHTFGGGQRHIADYLADEVLQRQPPEVQSFLLRTSLLERLSAPLCAAITGEENAQSMLESLERSNLFIVPLDGERQWYRYHPIWAEMLQARLKREGEQQVLDLHDRAAAWFVAKGFNEEAFRHFLAADQPEQAADLLEAIAKELVMHGGSATLQSRLEKLPAEMIRVRVGLQISQAWALVTDGRLEEATTVLDDLSNRRELPPDRQGEIAAIQSIIATIRQDISAIHRYADRALQLIPLDDSQLCCGVLLSQGTAAALAGAPKESAALLEQAIRESQGGRQPIIHLMAASTLAQTCEALGDFDRAERLHRQVIALEADPALSSLPLVGVGYVGLGGILHEHLRFDEAEAALQRGLLIGQRWGSPEIQIGAWISLVRLRHTQGYLDEAFTILTKLEKDFAGGMPVHEQEQIQSIKVRIWLAQGQTAKATAWARSLPPAAEQASFADEYQLLTLVRVLLMEHHNSQAQNLLLGSETASRAAQRNSLIEILLLKAQLPGAKENTLAEALALAEPQNQRRVFVDEPELYSFLQTWHAKHPEDEFAASLLTDFERRAAILRKAPALLSDREMDVLRLMAMGLSNQDIADRLVVALSTVKSRVKSILMKLEAENRTEAVAKARELELL